MAGLCSAYVWWDIARYPRLEGRQSVQVASHEQQTGEPLAESIRLEIARRGPLLATNTEKDAHPVIPNADEVIPDRKEQARRRAQARSDALRSFYSSQPRDSWAAETEIMLRDARAIDGVTIQEASCRKGICRVVASGAQRDSIFRTVSGATEMRTFARVVSDENGTLTVEGFISPKETQWPAPQGS